MKAEKIRELDGAEVSRQMQETQEQLFRFRFQMGMGQTEGLKKYRILRKDRARLLTVMQEKGMALPIAAAPAAASRLSPQKSSKKKQGK